MELFIGSFVGSFEVCDAIMERLPLEWIVDGWWQICRSILLIGVTSHE